MDSASFIEATVAELRENRTVRVILGLSGVYSTVTGCSSTRPSDAANLIFVNNGLLRKNEYEEVIASYRDMDLNVIGADAARDFVSALAGVTDPERKRKIIGAKFIETFERYACRISGARWLAQGTIYPDVIESAGIEGVASSSRTQCGRSAGQNGLKIVSAAHAVQGQYAASDAPSASRKNW